MPLRAVLFDLDDTLIWDERISRACLRETCALAAARHPLDAARLYDDALLEAEALWRAYAPVERCDALGIVAYEGMWGHFHGDEDYLRHLREWVPRFRVQLWEAALQRQGVADGTLARELGEHFRRCRRASQSLLPAADDVLRTLRGRGLRLGLLTNGAPDLQREKFEASGLASLFDEAVVSGEIGVGKPEPAIFHHLLERLGVAPAEALMVGNSLARDVAGAHRAGLRACWIALDGENEPVGTVTPDFTIRRLDELPPLVESLRQAAPNV